MKVFVMRILLCILMSSVAVTVLGQNVDDKSILIEKEVVSETTIVLKSIANNSGYDARVVIKNGPKEVAEVIIAKGDKIICSYECTRVSAYSLTLEGNSSSPIIWNTPKTSREWAKIQEQRKRLEATKTKDAAILQSSSSKNVVAKSLQDNESVKKTTVTKSSVKPEVIKGSAIVEDFVKWIESDSYISKSAIEKELESNNEHIVCIKGWNDKTSYIAEHHLVEYIRVEGKKLNDYKDEILLIEETFLSKYDKSTILSDVDYKIEINQIINERLSLREHSLDALKAEIDAVENTSKFSFHNLDAMTIVNIVALVVVIFILILLLVISARRKKNKYKPAALSENKSDAAPAIVVRRKTTSILKKQSLEDVVSNPAYFRIECSDFCNDSAVRRIYIKNICIKDIYNMYAEDLRNPDNPKEDGCMVLGRWVYDDQQNEYYVSLEEIVTPGDDAIFQEYELNFGGKIKLKVAEKLRRLRRETNLQYDLTCWVHSHPGLGVFFSNSDSGVQMQLKHPSHPNFLTAIVVDILTPQQEFGIFTFKHDSTINSKNDLKKMYSLEELHKWAIESERCAFRLDDYYNILSKADMQGRDYRGILLNNGAIIDLSSITTEQNSGLVGWIYGYMHQVNSNRVLVINKISRQEDGADSDLLGCLVIGTHCSIPSIRKALSDCVAKISFVLFYSINEETVTTIPIINGQLSIDEANYAEEKLEDLKIWTRRKR